MKHVLFFTNKIHSFSGKTLYISLLGMILTSLLEGIGIFLLIPLISLSGIMVFDSTNTPTISWISSFFLSIPETLSLSLILGIYVILVIGQSLFQRSQLLLNAKLQQSFVRHLREQTYKSLLQANWSFFLNKRKSDIINLMTTEITRVGGGIQLFLQFLASLVFTLIQVGIAFWLSAEMTLFVLFFGVTLIVCSRTFVHKSNSFGKETVLLSKSYLAVITDHFNGIKDIKSNSLEEPHLDWFQMLNEKIEGNIMKFVKLKTTSQVIYKVASALLIAVLVFFSVKMFQAQPTQLILIIVIFSRLWPRFSGIQSNLEQLGATVPSFKALMDLQDECLAAKEIHDREVEEIKPMVIEKGIDCQGVFFRYNPEQPDFALQNINIQIPVNQMTAIVGRSGAGKSTLIDLLMGLNQPEKGAVLIDGNQLGSENLLSLRHSVSYVPQDPFLFSATIRENLLIIDQNATVEEIWEALEFSAAADFVRKLPLELDTLIGDRGIKLSGGERQRLVLARAILRKPSILVLDEATSALDTENEAKIQGAIETLKGTMTIIIIAHRLSTIRHADQVVVMDQGKIIQLGGFNQLAVEKKGMFSHLLSNQMESSMGNVIGYEIN